MYLKIYFTDLSSPRDAAFALRAAGFGRVDFRNGDEYIGMEHIEVECGTISGIIKAAEIFKPFII